MAAFVEKKLGVKIFVGQFVDFSFPEKFSLIHMSHVLEHVPDPNHWLQKAKEMLETDGILVINVPNKFSLSSRLQWFFYQAWSKATILWFLEGCIKNPGSFI